MREAQQLIHPLDPVWNQESRVLILGTMPSPASRSVGFYYAHPRNRFWPTLARVFDTTLPMTTAERRDFALSHRIALWDVLASCEREGSLDSNITDEVPNPIGQLLTDYPSIRYILFNGGKAYQSFKKYFPDLLEQIAWQQMPSTSPAHTMKREEKRNRWQMILPLCK